MRRLDIWTVVVAAALVAATCGAVVPEPSPTPTASPAMDQAQVFFARLHQPPLGVPALVPHATGVEARIRARFDALANGPSVGPLGSFNLLAGATARLSTISTELDLATLDFTVATDDWGLRDMRDVRAFVQQVVFTATDEKSVYRVLLTANEGAPAVFAVSDMIVTYHAPLTREDVVPEYRIDHTVAYFAREDGPPMAVFLPGAGLGATAEERISSRLVALEVGPPTFEPDAFNVVRAARARLASVSLHDDLVVIDYRVPNGDWGVDGSTRVRAFLQQLVFTASEEPGIVRVLITQNGGGLAVVGGEGVVVDHPTSREDLIGF